MAFSAISFHLIPMSTNLQDITLQSPDGVLVATNEAGRLVYPMLFLNRQPTPEDAQGWDRVLVFIDGDGIINIYPSAINLNEENHYFQSLYIQTEGKWSISGVVEEYILLDSSSGQREGVGYARIDVMKAPALTIRGEYSCFFVITLDTADGNEIQIPVCININVPLIVNEKNHGETLDITLNNANQYTQLLTIIRDREWTLENVDTNIINVSPTSGIGMTPDFASTLTVTKSPDLTTTTATTIFQIVSLFQRVNVRVNIALAITGEFVDPFPGEEGVTGTSDLYLYL
jgi:hypothetical protein